MNRIARQDFTLPKYGDLQDKINDFIIAAKLHHCDPPEKYAKIEEWNKAKANYMQPTWENVIELLTEIRDTLNQDRYDPINRKW